MTRFAATAGSACASAPCGRGETGSRVKKSMFLGIEIGGTKLQLGVGPGDGTLRGIWRGAVSVPGGGEGIRRQIIAAVPDLLKTAGVERSAVRAVGVGLGGPVDDATRSVITSHQVTGW